MTLTVDGIIDEDGAMTLRLGDPPSPVPEPFALAAGDVLRGSRGERLRLRAIK